MAAIGCGDDPGEVRGHPGWGAFTRALAPPPVGSRRTVLLRTFCPDGGEAHGVGASVRIAALALGDAEGALTWRACQIGTQTVSGAVTTRVRRDDDGRLHMRGFHGRLRLTGPTSTVCDVALDHRPTAAWPHRHQGRFCGHAAELLDPASPG